METGQIGFKEYGKLGLDMISISPVITWKGLD